MHLWQRVSALALACLLPVVSGCGHKMAKVEGIVTLDGEPVEGATVTFIPDGSGLQASGRTGSDGVFRLSTRTTGDGVAHGTYKVIIVKATGKQYGSGEDVTDPDSLKQLYGQFVKDQRDKKKKKEKPKAIIPAVYSDPAKTDLKAQVPTDGPIKFELRSAGG